MSDLGLLPYFLGIEVNQTAAGITLCQTAYANKILERCGMQSCNPTATPMENRLKLSKTSGEQAVDATEYLSLLRALRYWLHTRPDLTFPIGYLSRFMEEPHEDHLVAVKRVLRYIASTHDYGLFNTGSEGETKLVEYNDADLAGDIDTRRSTSGIVFFLGRNPISWQSIK
jgi:hypothetical protein